MAATYEQLIAKARELRAAGDIDAARRVAQIAISRRDTKPAMSTQERVAAAKAGTLEMQPGSEARAASADARALEGMQPGTSALEQGGSGLNEGLAALAGTPVDLMTMGINAGTQGLNRLAGTNIPPITNPVGGSGTFNAALDPFISDVDPQTAGQRYARRIGKEVGYGAPIAVATGGGSVPVMAATALADTAAGVAGQTAREIAPENDTLDAVVTLLAGGGTAAGMSRPKKPPAPYSSTDEVFEAATAARNRMNESGVALTPDAQRELFDKIYASLKKKRMGPNLFPKTWAALEDVREMPISEIGDVNDWRRMVGKRLAAGGEETAAGTLIKSEIDNYLKALDPSDASRIRGSDPADALEAMAEHRNLYHQASKAKAVEGDLYRAGRRAATSGRGGNEVNTMRQNVGAMLEREVAPRKPGQPSGFSPDEIAQMERIAFGTGPLNLGRHVAGLAPTTGALQAAGNVAGTGGGLAASALMGNPLPAIASAVPGTAGLIAKRFTERATKNQIDELIDIILRGGTAATKNLSRTEINKRIAALLSGVDSVVQP